MMLELVACEMAMCNVTSSTLKEGRITFFRFGCPMDVVGILKLDVPSGTDTILEGCPLIRAIHLLCMCM